MATCEATQMQRFLILGWFWWKKPGQGYEKKNSNFQICQTQFLNLKTQPIGTWKLQCPSCCETSFRHFSECSVVPRINLSHTRNSYIYPKNQNYLLPKADLRFFLSYRLRTTIKITIVSTFQVINFQAVIVKVCVKRYRLFQ